jgi:adenine deaminase
MRISFVLLLVFILGAVLPSSAQRRKVSVDLIIRGGTVVTVDGSRRVIENGGVAIKGGRIVAVDDTADIDRQYAAQNVIDASGKVDAVSRHCGRSRSAGVAH